jgi:hypothetical protein
MHSGAARSAKLDFAAAFGVEWSWKNALLAAAVLPWWCARLDGDQATVAAFSMVIAVGRIRTPGGDTAEKLWMVRLYYVAFLQALLIGMRIRTARNPTV